MSVFVFKDWLRDVFLPTMLNYRYLILTVLLLVYIFHQDTIIEKQEDELHQTVKEYKDYKFDAEQKYNNMLIYYKDKELGILAKELQESKDKETRSKEK